MRTWCIFFLRAAAVPRAGSSFNAFQAQERPLAKVPDPVDNVLHRLEKITRGLNLKVTNRLGPIQGGVGVDFDLLTMTRAKGFEGYHMVSAGAHGEVLENACHVDEPEVQGIFVEVDGGERPGIRVPCLTKAGALSR